MKMMCKILSILFCFTSGLMAMEPEQMESVYEFSKLPVDIQTLVIEKTVYEECYQEGHAGKLGSVCKAWYQIIKADRPSPFSFYPTPHSLEDTCLIKIFSNGKLSYEPSLNSDWGKKVMPLSDFENPLEAPFDLSGCMGNNSGKICEGVNISTGYRKEINRNNIHKVEIFFVLRCVIAKEIKNNEAHIFKNILPHWKATHPVGIFWAWGNWNQLVLYDLRLFNRCITIHYDRFLKTWDEVKKNQNQLVEDSYQPICEWALAPLIYEYAQKRNGSFCTVYVDAFHFSFK